MSLTSYGRAPGAARKAARTALIGLDEATARTLSACFQQFNVVSVAFPAEERGRLLCEKFEACALRLDDRAADVLALARTAPSNFRMVIFGMASSTAQALRFSRYKINSILNDPLDSREAMRAVRTTHLLLLHEFRRYVRVPLVTPVNIALNGRHLRGQSHDISAGGISVKLPSAASPGNTVEMDFELPDLPRLRIAGSVRWVKNGTLGVHFDAAAPARQQIREWVDSFIGIS